jgi:Zn ribbon nucleic-acid-binding protein
MKCERCGGEKFAQLTIYCEDGTGYYQCAKCGFATSDRPKKPKKDHWFNEVTAGAIGSMFGCGGCFIYAALAMVGVGAGIWCCKWAWQFLCYAWNM